MADYTNLVALAEASVAHFARRPLFGERHDGRWEWLSYAGWHDRVAAMRARLAQLGIAAGDHVAIVSRNSAAWATAAYATYGLGAVFVPMYEAQRADDWEFILRDCGAAVVLARTPELAAKLREMQPRLPALRHVVTIEGDEPAAAEPVAVRYPQPEDVAGLIYTSGTTGRPKGVMLTHRNLTSNVLATLACFPIGPEDRTVSFLPWAHVYGQVGELHILVAAGASTAFNTNIDQLLADLREVKPTILVAVPRVFNKLYAAVRDGIAARGRVIRAVFRRGLAAAIRRGRGERVGLGDRMVAWLAGRLFARVRDQLGGRLRYALSGSATLSREVAEFIDAIGIPVYEGYGLTETSPIVTLNRPGQRKLGSVGLPIDGVRVEIGPDDEIIVHGPNVMKGYHGRPEENARAFTADGGLHTGDLGYVDRDGYLFITGRIKEQFKLENGKYVMPSSLEEQLAMSPYIANVVLHGANRPHSVALVAIDGARVRAWGHERGVALGDSLIADPRVRALIEGEVARLSKSFRSYERPRAVALIDAAFTIDNGLLTPTLKLKRREVDARYGQVLAGLYAPSPGATATAS